MRKRAALLLAAFVISVPILGSVCLVGTLATVYFLVGASCEAQPPLDGVPGHISFGQGVAIYGWLLWAAASVLVALLGGSGLGGIWRQYVRAKKSDEPDSAGAVMSDVLTCRPESRGRRPLGDSAGRRRLRHGGGEFPDAGAGHWATPPPTPLASLQAEPDPDDEAPAG